MRVLFTLCMFALSIAEVGAAEYFKIHVVDADSGRGVPMVELRTTANHFFITDSNGYIAFYEPGLMGQEVFFQVNAHGYRFPKDPLGYPGTAVRVEPGGAVILKVERVNIAERLYRTTGYGIYRDTVLLGERAPIIESLLNAKVTGSDSVQMVRYRGKLHWFWGDTNRPRHPLGTFQTPGAVSAPIDAGGLSPKAGIDLTYYLDGDGFAAGTAPMGDEGFTWMSGLMTVEGTDGDERMFAHFVRGVPDPPKLWKIIERGVMEWDPTKERFQRAGTWSMKGPFPDGAHSFLHDGYVYFADSFPRWRVRADPQAVIDQARYESYSCLPLGTQTTERGAVFAHGVELEFGWKRNTTTLSYADSGKLVVAGRIDPDEYPWRVVDAANNEVLTPHRGSIAWNEHRKRWVMIFGVTPDLGQIYYSECRDLIGDWSPARMIVTHDNYSFYNPTSHPELDEDGGRLIYLEGTYTSSFSGAKMKTPLYDYNQIMYRLDLTDPRLGLPDHE